MFNASFIKGLDEDMTSEKFLYLGHNCGGISLKNLRAYKLYTRFFLRRSYFGCLAHLFSLAVIVWKLKVKGLKGLTLYTSVTSSFSNNHAYFLKTLKFLGVKIILHLHGGNLIEKRRDAFFLQLLKNVDLVLCVSEKLFNYSKKYNPNTKIFYPVIGFGCKNVRQRNYKEGENIKILFVGSLKSLKDPLTVAKGFNYALTEYNYLKISFCGDGPLKSDLLRFRRDYQIADRMSVLGHYPNEKINELYESHNLYILSSEVEAMPISLLQAMFNGCLIIASKIDATVEILGEDYQFFFTQGNSRELANCIKKVVSLDLDAKISHSNMLRKRFNLKFLDNTGLDNLKNLLSAC